MTLPRPEWFDDALRTLLAREALTAVTMTAAMRDLVAGRVDPPLAAALLTALRIKGETAAEIAAAALVLREQMIRLVPVSGPVLDTCGTGGDGANTFNISTAAAIVVAAAGVPVVKHGGRAVSSRSGSADVLRQLGVAIESGPEWSQRCLDRLGFAFCYAPQFHGGMKHIAGLRRTLGFRTLFNLLGPLANPANADYQLLGVGDPALLEPLAGAAAELGLRKAVVVCGHDGLDEVTLTGPTRVRVVEADSFRHLEWTPADYGLPTLTLSELAASDAVESAAIVQRVLDGENGPHLRIVLANAAAALWAADRVKDVREGVALATETVKNGTARGLLASVVAMK